MSKNDFENSNDKINKENTRSVFLYVVIGVLVAAIIALGAVSFLSLNRLVTLQQKVKTLSDTVQDISTDANTLINQADQLDQLKETGKIAHRFCRDGRHFRRGDRSEE